MKCINTLMDEHKLTIKHEFIASTAKSIVSATAEVLETSSGAIGMMREIHAAGDLTTVQVMREKGFSKDIGVYRKADDMYT